MFQIEQYITQRRGEGKVKKRKGEERKVEKKNNNKKVLSEPKISHSSKTSAGHRGAAYIANVRITSV